MIPKNPFQFLLFALVIMGGLFSSPDGIAQVRLSQTGTASPADTLGGSVTDTSGIAPRGAIETTINYDAKDSIRFDAINQITYLHGSAHVDYGEISLDAALIEINWRTGILTADGLIDSTGSLTQKPLFKNGAETYEAERIRYNYKSKKGVVTNTVTTQGEGYIHAKTVKRDSLGNIYGRSARYTTCDLEHPHFYIKATKMKVIPNDRVIAGPFHMVFADVPLPIGLPFGFFPSPRTRGSGVIIPTFGETTQQGFYLRDGGFYWAMNEYMDMRLTGDIYSLGGYGARVQSTYNKRYRFRGSFNLSYANNPAQEDFQGRGTGENRNINSPQSSNFAISWSHTPVTRPGQGQFSASVQASSMFYHQYNSVNPLQTLAPAFSSNVSYRKSTPNSPITYAISLQQSQSTAIQKNKEGLSEQVQVMSMVLPDVALGVSSQSPLEWFGASMTGRWIEGIRLGYNMRARQDVSNQISGGTQLRFPFEQASRQDTILPINGGNLSNIFRNARVSVSHDIPLTLPTISLLKHFKLTPGVNYSESWFTKKYDYRNVPGSDRLTVDTLSGLHRAYQFSAGVSLNTNIYGTANIQGKKIEAIRHTLTPSISYNYRPDFGGAGFGFYQQVQTDSLGKTQLLSRFPNSGNVPGAGLSSAFSFGIDNNVEMKVKTDSTGVFRKVSLIDRFSFRGSYNAAADSFQLSNISVDLSTRLFNKLPLNLNATLDPYQYVNGQRTRKYQFEKGGINFARITNLNVGTNFEFSPRARQQQQEAAQNGEAPLPTNIPSLQRNLTAADYVDFDIPWTLSAGFTSNFARDFRTDKLVNVATSLDVNGSVTLTTKWAFNYTTSYDFKSQALSYTNLSITRDLHCWQMSINWVPFGTMQMYSININAKSALLQDLKIRRSDSYYGQGR